MYRRTLGTFIDEGIADTSGSYSRSSWVSSGNDVIGEMQGVIGLGRHTLTAGFDGLLNTIGFGARVNPETGDTLGGAEASTGEIYNAGIYLQGELVPTGKLRVVPGVRGDYHSDYGWAFSPKLGLSYELTSAVSVRSSLGRAFRAPTLGELSMPDVHLPGNFVVRANPHLTPEYLWAVDGGVVVERRNRLSGWISGFFNQMSGLIIPDVRNFEQALDGAVTHRNTSEAWAAGMEMEIDGGLTPSVHLSVGYGYTLSRDEEVYADPDYTNRYIGLDYVPRHKGSIALSFRRAWERVSIEAKAAESVFGARGYLDWQGIDKDSVRVIFGDSGPLLDPNTPYVVLPPYARTDALVRLTLDKRYWLGLAVENATNVKFEESGGTWAPGRMIWIKGGVSL